MMILICLNLLFLWGFTGVGMFQILLDNGYHENNEVPFWAVFLYGPIVWGICLYYWITED